MVAHAQLWGTHKEDRHNDALLRAHSVAKAQNRLGTSGTGTSTKGPSFPSEIDHDILIELGRETLRRRTTARARRRFRLTDGIVEFGHGILYCLYSVEFSFAGGMIRRRTGAKLREKLWEASQLLLSTPANVNRKFACDGYVVVFVRTYQNPSLCPVFDKLLTISACEAALPGNFRELFCEPPASHP